MGDARKLLKVEKLPRSRSSRCKLPVEPTSPVSSRQGPRVSALVQVVFGHPLSFTVVSIPHTHPHNTKMKWSTTLAVALLPATALARFVSKRSDVTTTDTYLFDITLAQFIVYRDALNPATLDWDSDGCTDSPDNPLGFNFVSSNVPGSPMHIESESVTHTIGGGKLVGAGMLPP